MADLRVIEFPKGNAQDIPSGLRSLADLIEQGAIECDIPGLTGATRLAWVAIDGGENVEIGMLGGSFDRFVLAGILGAGMKRALP